MGRGRSNFSGQIKKHTPVSVMIVNTRVPMGLNREPHSAGFATTVTFTRPARAPAVCRRRQALDEQETSPPFLKGSPLLLLLVEEGPTDGSGLPAQHR